MIKTLIVDDNKVIREYFEKMVDWKALGFELVAVAANGISGWHAFNEHRPQLVISDVHMPGMTGLELAKKIKDTAPDTTVIFISNYEDFGYVKGAMELGAFDYVLKHEARGIKLNERLLEINAEVSKRIRQSRNRRESQLILALNAFDDNEYENAFPDRYTMLLVEQTDILPPFRGSADPEMKRIGSSFYIDFFYRRSRDIICCVKSDKHTCVALLSPDCDCESLAAELNRETYGSFHVRSYTLILGENMPIRECIAAYNTGREQIKRKFFDKYRYYFRPDTGKKEKKPDIDKEIAVIRNSLTECDMEKVCEAIDRMADSANSREDYGQLCETISALLDVLMGYSVGNTGERFSVFQSGDENFWTNSSEVFYWLKNKFVLLVNYLRQNPTLTYSEPVKNAIIYMERNYSRTDLTIGEISDHVGLSPNQLSILMKNETGLTTIKWLTGIRMDRAKKLLSNNRKVSDVYTQVGYTNLSYFANAFKKVTGETPVEYRRRNHEKED